MLVSPAFSRSLAVIGLTLALTAGGALLAAGERPVEPSLASSTSDITFVPGSDLGSQIDQLQTHLSAQPQDARRWAVLSLILVEQARVTADSSLYTRAEAAADRSLRAQPKDNDLTLAAQATLAAAQHRFSTALRLARRSLAINPYSTPALAIQVDALTELGRSASAARAAAAMDAVQPGLAASTRLAYQAELRGQQQEAQQLFRHAANDSTSPETKAFVEFHLGELARQRGDFAQALSHYRVAQDALPADVSAAAGRASVLAANGGTQRAIKVLRDVVTRVPLPQHVIALGELLEVTGDHAGASQQYAIVDATIALAKANGVRVDLELAQFEADHGSPAKALGAARAEWHRRHAPQVADALAWALQQSGRSHQALGFAETATSLGGDARAWHHLGVIEAALGRNADAREALHTALALDQSYPAWQLAQLRQVQRSLEGKA